jgi:hypothetical protein
MKNSLLISHFHSDLHSRIPSDAYAKAPAAACRQALTLAFTPTLTLALTLLLTHPLLRRPVIPFAQPYTRAGHELTPYGRSVQGGEGDLLEIYF